MASKKKKPAEPAATAKDRNFLRRFYKFPRHRIPGNDWEDLCSLADPLYPEFQGQMNIIDVVIGIMTKPGIPSNMFDKARTRLHVLMDDMIHFNLTEAGNDPKDPRYASLNTR